MRSQPQTILSLRFGAYSFEGGIERFCRDSDRVIAAAGYRHTAIALWDRQADLPPSTERNHYYGCNHSKVRFLGLVLRTLFAMRPALVCFQHLFLARMIFLAWLCPGARTMVWVYGKEVWMFPGRLSKLALTLVDRIVSISNFTARRLQEVYGIRDGHTRICPLGLGTTRMVAPDRGAISAPPMPFVLVVSRLVRPDAVEKGVLRVCEAMRIVREQVPDAVCVVVGDGPDRGRLEAAGKAAAGDDAAVIFTGHVTDASLNVLYESASVFALPSIVEGFGLVYVEAMAHRLPVIAGTDDAAGEVVRHGETGLVVESMNVEAIAGAIVDLLRNRDRRLAMGQAGYARQQQYFSCSSAAARLRAVIDEAMQSGSTAGGGAHG